MGKIPLKKRLEQDENWILKLGGELGDVCKFIYRLQEQVNKLKKRVEELEREKN